MKRFVGIILAVLMLSCCISFTVFAEDEIKIVVDGNAVASDVAPQIIDGRTLVPLRAITEMLGLSTEWYGDEKKVVVNAPVEGDPFLVMYISDKNVNVYIWSGQTGETSEHTETLDVPPTIIEGRTFVPLRFIAEAVGMDVNWDEATKTIYLDFAVYGTDVTDVYSPDPPDFELIYDESQLSDPPEGCINLFQAVKFLDCQINIAGYDLSHGGYYSYKYEGIITVDGEEYYSFSFGFVTNGEYTPESLYHVSLYGDIFQDY